MEGRRYRHRRSAGGLRWYFGQLERSRHPAAFVAQIALARGFFRDSNLDALGRVQSDEEFMRLEEFLRADTAVRASVAADLPSEQSPLHDRFRECYRTGKAVLDANDPATFRRCMTILNSQANSPTAWISKLALCQGLLATASDDSEIEADYGRLSDFLSAAGQSLNNSRSPARVSVKQAAQNDSGLDGIMAYAANIGLRRFVVAPPTGANYAMSAGEDSYHRTPAEVIGATDASRRPRIKVPFQLFGHIVCTEPERMAGLFWCFDLLKAGYLFGHVPTSFGSQRVLLPWLFARHVLERCGWRAASLTRPSRSAAALSWMAKSRKPRYEPEPGRVLMMTENLVRGGSERQMVAATLGLLRRGYDVKMFILSRLGPGDPSYEAEVVDLGITPEYASDTIEVCGNEHKASGGFRPADCAALPKWLTYGIVTTAATVERHRPAVVHCWLDRPGIAGALAAAPWARLGS